MGLPIGKISTVQRFAPATPAKAAPTTTVVNPTLHPASGVNHSTIALPVSMGDTIASHTTMAQPQLSGALTGSGLASNGSGSGSIDWGPGGDPGGDVSTQTAGTASAANGIVAAPLMIIALLVVVAMFAGAF